MLYHIQHVVYLSRPIHTRLRIYLAERAEQLDTKEWLELLHGDEIVELGKLERLLREYPRRPLTDQTIWDVAGLTSAITGVREQGFCLLREEFERGICSLAVPIQNSTGQVVAAMNVCCHTWQKSAEQMETEFLPAMRQAAAEISGSLT